MTEERVFINGRFVSASGASVSVFDRGFNYGDGLFETMKARGGRVLFLKDHLERMKHGARALGIPAGPLRQRDMEEKIKKLLQANGLLKGDAYVRVTLTRGMDTDGPLPRRGTAPTLVITARAIDAEKISRKQKRGIRAVTLETRPPSIPRAKTLNHLPSVLGRMEARRRGASEGLFVGPDGRLTEGTSTNLFLVFGGLLKTPPLSDGLLPGVTRKKVLDVAGAGGIRTVETTLFTSDLERCSEAFLTNSILDIVPLVRVDDKSIAGGRSGSVTKRIQRLYADLVSLETAGVS